jgi:hypothetical protein
MDTLHGLNEQARVLMPFCAAFNGVLFGYALANRQRWFAVWSGFWCLACLVAT